MVTDHDLSRFATVGQNDWKCLYEQSVLFVTTLLGNRSPQVNKTFHHAWGVDIYIYIHDISREPIQDCDIVISMMVVRPRYMRT